MVSVPATATHIEKALVGFQGRGCADGVQPNRCPPFLLEVLLFQWASIRRCASRTLQEPQTPESNKSERRLSGRYYPSDIRGTVIPDEAAQHLPAFVPLSSEPADRHSPR